MDYMKSRLANFLYPSAGCNLLLIFDNDDALKRCANNVEQRIKPHTNSITLHRIYDPDNDRTDNKCDKVIFLLKPHTKDQSKQIQLWTNELDNIKDNKDNVLLLYFGVPSDMNEDPTVEDISTDNVLVVPGLHDAFLWFPKLLRFVFGKQNSTWEQFNKQKNVYFQDMCSNENTMKGIKESTKAILEEFIVSDNSTLDNKNCTSVVLFCDKLNQTVPTELREKLRAKKLNGSKIYVIASSTSSMSEEMKWISTSCFSKQEHLDFIFQIMVNFRILKVQCTLENARKPSPPKGPIMFESPGSSEVTLSWTQSQISDTGMNIVIQKRLKNVTIWETIERYPDNGSSRRQIKDLDQTKKYMFRIMLENANGISRPLSSGWFSLNPENVDFKKLCVKGLLIVLAGITIVLDLFECIIIFAVTFPIVVLLSLGIDNNKREEQSHISNVTESKWNIFFIICHFILFVIWSATGHLMFSLDLIFQSSGSTEQADGRLVFLYVFIMLFLLCWPCIIHYVSITYFDCESGVFSIPFKLFAYAWNIQYITKIYSENENGHLHRGTQEEDGHGIIEI